MEEHACFCLFQEPQHRFPQAQTQHGRQAPEEHKQARDEAPCSRRRGCSRSSARRDRRTSRATLAESIQLQYVDKVDKFWQKFTLALKVWSF